MKQLIIICSLFTLGILNPIISVAINLPTDTLIVRLGGNNQVRIISASFDNLYKYSRADSLISVFATDIQKSFQDKDYADWPQVMHYLVKGDGKRRLKIQSNEFTDEEFNLENEKYRLYENLPVFHYIIYDLSKSVELHLYLDSASKINLFKDVKIDSAIKILSQNKNTCDQSYKIEISQENGLYRIVKSKGNKMYSISYSPDVSAFLIANRWVPSVGGRLDLILKDKHAKPVLLIGVAIVGYGFYDLNNGVFNVATNAGYNFRMGFNLNKKQGNTTWFGFEAGIIKGKESNELGFKGQAFRLNMFTEINGIGFSFGSIKDANKTAVPIIGIRLPF